MVPRVCLSSLTVLFLANSISWAQEKKPEWIVTIYGGQNKTEDSSLTIRRPGENTVLHYQNVQWRDRSYEMPPYYGLRISFWPTPNATFGYGIDFVHYKVYAVTGATTTVTGTLNGVPYNQVEPISNTLDRFSISHGVNLTTFNLHWRNRQGVTEDYPSGRFQPYAGIGAGFVINHPESEIDGDFFEKYQWGGFGWQVFFGAEYRFNPKWGLFLEYKFTDYKAKVDTAQNGTGEARFKSNHIALGTTIRVK